MSTDLREDGRPFDAIDRLIAHVGLVGPLSLAEVAMERHDTLLDRLDGAEKALREIERVVAVDGDAFSAGLIDIVRAYFASVEGGQET